MKALEELAEPPETNLLKSEIKIDFSAMNDDELPIAWEVPQKKAAIDDDVYDVKKILNFIIFKN